MEKPQTRTASLIQADEAESGVYELSFSSDNESLSRGAYNEVLLHGSENVRLERLNERGPLLLEHDRARLVGSVVNGSARLDSDGKGRALINFSSTQAGKDAETEMLEGHRAYTSVQYLVHDYEEERNDKTGEITVKVVDWEPIEVTLTCMPFDPTVGIGRSELFNDEVVKMTKEKSNESSTDEKVTTPFVPKTPEVDPDKIRSEALASDRKRRDAIVKEADHSGLDELGKRACDEGWSLDDFRAHALQEIGKRNATAVGTSKHNGDVDLSTKDQQRYSLFRAMEALAFPNDRETQKRAAFELEVGQASVADYGNDYEVRGVYIPPSLMSRAVDVGTSNKAGELVATDLMSGSFIEFIRERSMAIQAGATVLSGLVGNVAVPKQTGGATAGWIATEDGDAPESEPTFDQVSLTPKDMGVFTEVTRRSLQQSTPAVEGLIRRDMFEAVAQLYDNSVFYGTGASGQPTGISNQTGVIKGGSLFAAAAPTYAELVSLIKQLMDNKVPMGDLSWIIDPSGWEALMTTSKQASGVEGNFILDTGSSSIVGLPYRTATNMTAGDYLLGRWSDVLIGEWGGLDIVVDPYTHSAKGRSRFVMFKTADVAVRHGNHFVLGNDDV